METIKKILSEPLSYFVFYSIMVIITFGDAYHRTTKEETKSFAGVTYTVHYETPIRSVEALFASFFWPLYWSARLQDPK